MLNKETFLNKNNIELGILYNPYAEELIIKAILLHENLLDYIFSEADEDIFYLSANRIFFKATRKLYTHNKPITAVNLISQLEDEEKLDLIGGKDSVSNMMNCNKPISITEITIYLAVLKDKLIKRSLLKISILLSQIAHSNENYININFKQIENELSRISTIQTDSSITRIKDLIKPTLNKLQLAYIPTTSKAYSLVTGFKALDASLNKLDKGNLIIVAGRPSMGKTAFGLSLIMNVCKQKQNASILIFSLEMSSFQITNRLMVIDSELPSKTLSNLEYHNNSFTKSEDLFPTIYNSNIYINDDSSMTLTEIESSIKKIVGKNHSIDLIFIDYLQLLGNSENNRTQEISLITRNLKKMARQFNVPILLLSQLNRNVEQRTNKRPLLSDLRESGCLLDSTLILSKNLKLYNNVKLRYIVQEKFILLKSYDIKNYIAKETLNFQKKEFRWRHTYKFQINSTIKLFLTANHKLLTKIGWKRLEILLEKDIILNLIEKNLLWKKIETISYSRISSVLDLRVPPFSNFIANQIIVHNSIEQDADVVLLLYRESYYNNIKNISKDMAEIIIAKNRNGLTGTITLEFNHNLVKFKNAKNQV